MRYLSTPLGALVRGLIAGVAGAEVQNLFFKFTARLAPPTPKDVFVPPEDRQAGETATGAVARRFVEDFMKRGPLDGARKARGSEIVHLGFGAAWGGLWGLARESHPRLHGPAGIAAYSTIVWMLGDNLMLPAFKLAAPPQAYPARTHAYALAAHLAYGLGLWASYESMRRPFWDVLSAMGWALVTKRAVRRRLPRFARPTASKVIEAAARMKARRPIASFIEFAQA